MQICCCLLDARFRVSFDNSTKAYMRWHHVYNQLFCITLGIVHLSKSHKMLSCYWMSDIILRRGVLQVALIKTRGPYWSSLLGDRSHLELTTGDQRVQYTPKYIPPLSGSLGLQ